jgi:hypothetical protein
MLLKEKSNMKALFCSALFLIILCFAQCGSESESKKEKRNPNDSLSKTEQRYRTDSMKKLNPLLILPPDSIYTGEYVDKYPNGITKFRGFYRIGQRHGQWLSFYPNGLLWSEMHYDKGLRHGPNMAYFETVSSGTAGFIKTITRIVFGAIMTLLVLLRRKFCSETNVL